MDVLVVLPLNEEQKARLAAARPEARFLYVKPRELDPANLPQVDVLIGVVPEAILKAQKKLSLLQLSSSGVSGEVIGHMRAHPDLTVCSATGAYGQAVSEHMFAQLWGMLKRLPQYRDGQRAKDWKSLGTIGTLAGAQVLVVGLGDIGLRFARLCSAVGAHVTGVRRRPGETPEGVEAVYGMEALDSLLPKADVVALVLPDTPKTRDLFDDKRLGLMKKGSFLVNAGRGTVLDEDALAKRLLAGDLAGAALDVTRIEPLPEDSPLWDIPTVSLTPHISGFFHLPQTLFNIVDIAAHNLAHYPGGPFISQVDPDTGYRK